MSDANDDKKPEITADNVLKYLEEHYDITKDDLLWWRDYHRSIQKYGDWIAKVIVTSFVLTILSGLGFLLWEGFKHFLHSIKGA